MTKIFIWNAHWKTLGGGEVYAATLANLLASENYEVHLLGNMPSPLDQIQERLGINLSNVNYLRIQNENDISNLLHQNDIFINGSFGSNFRAPIENSIFIVHFPTHRIRQKINKFLLKPLPVRIRQQDGRNVYLTGHFDLLIDSGTIHIAEGNGITLSSLYGSADISSVKGKQIEISKGQKFDYEGPDSLIVKKMSQISSVLKIVSQIKTSPFQQLTKNRYFSGNGFVGSYKQLWSNSKFTQKYVLDMWKSDSELVYPPVRSEKSLDSYRNPYQIISVGRFMSQAEGHSKNQLLLIEAFKNLCKESDKPWELHLCGGVSESTPDYYKKVEASAKASKLSITMHPNCSNEELQKLFNSSTFYWHAAGLGIKESQPEKMEHFGITVVEAINSGLIPLAYNVAGPAEILFEFTSLTYSTLYELSKKTIALLQISTEHESELRLKLMRQAQIYSVESFKKIVLERIKLLH